jgi:hypothetical protein
MRGARGANWAWSVSLVLGGIVLLLFNFGWLDAYEPWPQFLLAIGCAVGATIFFVGYARSRAEWWQLLPAWTLTSLATMALTSILPDVGRALLAAQVFGGLALAFGHIYLAARTERWWAILPGGFMLVLALVVGASAWVEAVDLLAGLLFVGLGLVFFLLYLLDQKRRQWWALIPGSVLVVFGALALAAGRVEEAGLLRWWPLALILLGLLLALRPARKTAAPPDKLVINSAPAPRPQGSAAGKPAAPGAPRGALGEYTQPAPGASVEILPDND